MCFWRDTYYLSAEPVIAEQDQKSATENILKFKTLLHANDAGLDIYLKKFGKEMIAVIESAAFGSEPALNNKTDIEIENSNLLEQSSSDTGIIWTDEAEQYIQDAPKFIRSKIRENAEKKALELGIKEITRTFIENLRK